MIEANFSKPGTRHSLHMIPSWCYVRQHVVNLATSGLGDDEIRHQQSDVIWKISSGEERRCFWSVHRKEALKLVFGRERKTRKESWNAKLK